MKKLYLILSFSAAIILALILTNKPQTTMSVVHKNALPKLFSQKKAFVKGKLKKDSPNLFADYQMLIRTKFGSDKPDYRFNYLQSELQKARESKSLSKTNDLSFKSKGPGNVGGRARGIIIDPDDAYKNTWFIAAVGGGVWKTTDAGKSWSELTEAAGSLSASCLAMAPSNHDIIYLGTGEGYGNLDALGGQGIWKSTDRGASWTQLVKTAESRFGIVNRIIVDPSNPNLLLAVTSKSYNNLNKLDTPGIWKSTDGGKTWIKKHAEENNIQQIINDPSDFNVQYATVNKGGILKSTDAGNTWVQIAPGLKSGRIEMAVTSLDANRLYASVDGAKSSIYVSSDKGNSWTQCSTTVDFLGGQGWYDNAIIVDPFDKNIVFVAGVNIYKVNYKGGNQIDVTTLTDNYGGDESLHKGTHVDNHYFQVAKLSNRKFRLVGTNDGGVCYTDDSGETFTQPIAGLVTSQFYSADKAPKYERYMGGMQDNSCYVSPYNSSSSGAWRFVFGGDGFDVIWNYQDANKVMLSSQYNQIAITSSGIETLNSTGWLADVDKGRDKAPFFTKLAQSKQYGDLVLTHGINGVWRTEDFGVTWENVAMPANYDGKSSATEIDISLANPKIVWTGGSLVEDVPMYVSTDYGKTFTKANTVTNTYVKSYISGFATHPKDEKTAYALFSASKMSKIMRTTDLGKTWEDISGIKYGYSSKGFPDVAVYSLFVMPYDTNIIWAGTEIGIVQTTDGGESWKLLDSNMPPVAIYDMKVVNGQLVIATHGRGVWTVDIPKLSDWEPPKVVLPTSVEAKYLYKDSKQYAEISLAYKGDYDKVEVFVNGVSKQVFNNVSNGDTQDLQSEISVGKNVVKVVSEIGGESYESEFEIEGLPLKSVASAFVSDFNTASSVTDNFHGEGYTISQPDGFDTKALNTNHPYPENQEMYLYLTTPITVSSEHPEFMYKDVAIVEPGEAGKVYPNEEFWDYVTIEASTDGQTWKKLITPYDAGSNTGWSDLYGPEVTETPTKSNLVAHTFNTTDFFNSGEVILIRFKLFSDAASTGWGWLIDDLEIQKGALSIEDNEIAKEFKVYPNPVVNDVLYFESSTTNTISEIELYGVDGKLYKKEKYSKVSNIEFNVSSVSKGNYIVKVTTDKGSFAKKILVK